MGIRNLAQHTYSLFPSALSLYPAFIMCPDSFLLSERIRGISNSCLHALLHAGCSAAAPRGRTLRINTLLPSLDGFCWHVLMDMHTHISIPTPSASGSHERPQQSKEFEPLFEQMAEFVDLPSTAAEQLCPSQPQWGSGWLRGTFGSGKVLGRFWVAFATCLLAMKRRGMLLSKAIYSC